MSEEHDYPRWLLWWFGMGLVTFILSLPKIVIGLIVGNDALVFVGCILATVGSMSVALSLLKGRELAER